MQHGYEHSRITNLKRQSRWAVDALDGIHSTDPAAAEAMTAVAGMKSVIANGLIPAATTITVMDPLGAGGATSFGIVSPEAPNAHPTVAPNPYEHLTDDELLEEFLSRNEGIPFVARFDPDHPHWDDFADLADEIALRSRGIGPRTISSFGELLIDNAALLPALPVAIATGDFDPYFSVAVLQAIFDPALAIGSELHRIETFGVDLVLDALIEHPEAMAQLARDDYHDIQGGLRTEDTVLFQLLDSDVIDQQILAAALTATLDVDGPVALVDIERAMVVFVAAANTGAFERGFPSPIATVLALAVVDLFPQLNGQISLRTPIYFDEIDDAEGLFFGEYSDVVDLLGAILIDPAGMIILFAIAAESNDILLAEGSQLDVHAFAELLSNAFEENLAEIDIANARTRNEWNIAIGVLTTAVGLGPVAKTLGPLGGKFAQEVIMRFAAIAAGGSGERSEAEDVGHLAQIMILFGSYEGFLDDYEARGGTGSASARLHLDQAWNEFDNGATLGKVSETLQDTRNAIIELGGESFLNDRVEDAIDGIDPFGDDPDLEM